MAARAILPWTCEAAVQECMAAQPHARPLVLIVKALLKQAALNKARPAVTWPFGPFARSPLCSLRALLKPPEHGGAAWAAVWPLWRQSSTFPVLLVVQVSCDRLRTVATLALRLPG